MKKRLSHAERHDRRRRIAEAVRAGRSVASVCREFKVAKCTVYGAMEEFGVPVGKPDTTPNVYAIIAALVNTGGSLKKIAAKIGVSHQRVSQVKEKCLAAGIPVRPLSG